LPEVLTSMHPRFKTPHVVTMITGTGVVLAAAFFPVGKLAIYPTRHLGRVFAVALGVMIFASDEPGFGSAPSGRRSFGWWAPLALIGCLSLFALLPIFTILVFFAWAAFGLLVYASYGYRRSAFATTDPKPPTLTPKLS